MAGQRGCLLDVAAGASTAGAEVCIANRQQAAQNQRRRAPMSKSYECFGTTPTVLPRHGKTREGRTICDSINRLHYITRLAQHANIDQVTPGHEDPLVLFGCPEAPRVAPQVW
jgi:hypothetical protein